MPFPERFLDELISRNDIADVVSMYVQLNKRSGSNMFGLCPFHSEKTPSFSVSPEKQIYHCFGCGKGGGAINFIMEIENLSYPDAVHFLAKRVGLSVPDDDEPEETRSRRAAMLEINKDAARFFYETLKTPQGALAVEYIKKRGISPEMVKRFGLGAAPDSWNALADAMRQKGYTDGEMLAAGLVKKGQKGGVYDAFRNRLMFPVIDVRGSVIGFSGRILDDGEPKYLNSSDTLIFNKSRNLFALNLAKKSKEGMLILAEGNIDVVSLHQVGIDCAVASLGTSLTPEQARLMARYTNKVVISYDSDGAGIKAAQRAIGILEKTGVGVKVLRMEGAKDPDEYIQKRGADAFRLLLDKSENHIEYRLLSIKSRHEMTTDDDRIAFLTEATELLSELGSPVEREIYGTRVAEFAGVSAEAVASEVKKSVKRRASGIEKKQERAILRPEAAMQPKDRALRYENAVSATAEEGVIRLLLMDSSLTAITGSLSEEDFTSEFLAKAFRIINDGYRQRRTVTIPALAQDFEPSEISQLTALIQKPETMNNREQAMHDYIEKIKAEKLRLSAKDDLLAASQRYREKKGYGG